MTPLVLVHGFMGGSDQWRQQRKALEGDFDVITVDLPGFGKNAHLQAPASIPAFAQWVLSDLTAHGIDRFHLLGHSMGGMIVQDMIAAAPERIESLVLYGTGATGILPGRFEPIRTSRMRAQMDGPRDTARRISATWFLKRETADAYEHCARIAEKSSLQAIVAGLDAMEAWSGVDQLSRIDAHTLVIWGDHDRTYPWSQIEQLWRSIGTSSLAVLPGCAHAAHLEKPALFNGILADFLQARRTGVEAPRSRSQGFV